MQNVDINLDGYNEVGYSGQQQVKNETYDGCDLVTVRRVHFQDCVFKGCHFSGEFYHTTFSDCWIEGCDFYPNSWSVGNMEFKSCVLENNRGIVELPLWKTYTGYVISVPDYSADVPDARFVVATLPPNSLTRPHDWYSSINRVEDYLNTLTTRDFVSHHSLILAPPTQYQLDYILYAINYIIACGRHSGFNVSNLESW